MAFKPYGFTIYPSLDKDVYAMWKEMTEGTKDWRALIQRLIRQEYFMRKHLDMFTAEQLETLKKVRNGVDLDKPFQ